MYANPELAGDNLKQLPMNLLDAIRNFENDTVLKAAMGNEFCDAYCKLKRNDWSKYTSSLSQWESDTTLDC
jgi:glutamine synthetase